jgi:hypothetical protein
MTSGFSRIAIGAALACACHLASAQNVESTVTVTQQGNGNTSYAEQYAVTTPNNGAQLTITQIGDNNHVGGPGATTGGVIQRNTAYGPLVAQVQQNGKGNNAGLIQENNGNAAVAADGRITQLGNGNDAALRQADSSYVEAVVEQSGTGNLARIEQLSSGDAGLRSVQNGSGNQVTISQTGGSYGGPNLTQNGDGNTASVTNYGAGAGAKIIVQTGTQNHVTAYQTLGWDQGLQVHQTGTGNQADANLTGDAQITLIDQIGNDNLASVNQSGPTGTYPGNTATIAQLGNSNTAIVRQVGQNYVANVSQVGSGNYTNIYQH